MAIENSYHLVGFGKTKGANPSYTGSATLKFSGDNKVEGLIKMDMGEMIVEIILEGWENEDGTLDLEGISETDPAPSPATGKAYPMRDNDYTVDWDVPSFGKFIDVLLFDKEISE